MNTASPAMVTWTRRCALWRDLSDRQRRLFLLHRIDDAAPGILCRVDGISEIAADAANCVAARREQNERKAKCQGRKDRSCRHGMSPERNRSDAGVLCTDIRQNQGRKVRAPLHSPARRKAQLSRPASAHGFAFNSTFIMPGELTVTLIPLQLVPNRMGPGRLKNEKAKDNDRGGRNIGTFAR